MMFQALDGKGNHFLNLLNDKFNIIELFYVKGGSWLQPFEHSNLPCIHVTRAITNHTPIGEYKLRFFLREEFKCLYSLYPIESQRYILFDCRRFNSYQNPRRNSLSHFVMFLEANPNVFAFIDNSYSTSVSRSYSQFHLLFLFFLFLSLFLSSLISSFSCFNLLLFSFLVSVFMYVCVYCMQL